MDVFKILIIIFCFSVSNIILSQDLGNVGDIKASVLSLEEFQKLNGKEWVLLDGNTILSHESSLGILTGWSIIPDARGRFFRMKDYGANIDSSGDVNVGTLEDFRTARPKRSFVTDMAGYHNHEVSLAGIHSHGMKKAGSHSHFYESVSGGGGITNKNGWEGTRRNLTSPSGLHKHTIFEGKDHNGIKGHAHDVNNDGNHDHSIVDGGDKETRPVNIIVNYFIKIEESKKCPMATSTKEEVSSRFMCLQESFISWKNGKTFLTEIQLARLVQQIVFLKKTSFRLLNEDQMNFINILMNSFSNYLILN